MLNKLKLSYLIITALVMVSVNSLMAQVNTPSGANWPFGSRIQQFPTAPYNNGIIPTNLPSGAYTPASNLYGKSQDAYTAYVAWKTNYTVSCGGSPTSIRIKFDDPTQTVSEGIGYGMLIAAYAADKALFDGLYTYYRNNIVTGYGAVMGWKRNGCANGNTGSSGEDNGATDADLDAAMALIVAKCQWPTATSPYDYGAQATTLIGQIRQWEITNAACGTANQISNGDGFVVGNSTCRNPGYQAPGYIQLFQAYDPGAAAGYWTTTVAGTIYPMLNANANATTGLVSNWCDNTGTANTCNAPAFLDYGYDACRYPWRIATDYIWNGNTSASTLCARITDNFIGTRATLGNAGSYSAIKGPVTQAGATNGRTTPSENSIFTSTWAVGCMGVTSTANRQTRLNDMYGRTVAVQEAYSASQPTNYFNNTLRTLMLFVMTGNFWKPCPPRCQAPTLPSDTVSICIANPITLSSSLSTATNRTFSWFKNGSNLSVSTPTLSVTNAMGAGKYWVQVDSTGCSRADTVIVSANLPYPKLGPNKTICSPTPTLLDAAISNSPAYTYQWAYSSSFSYGTLKDIGYNGTSQTYSATKPGLYRVTVSGGSCTARMDTISIFSQLPTPINGCINPGPGTVSLGITNTTGAASNYDWYNAATGGSIVSGGTGVTTFTTPSISSTTTYYVQDNTPQPGYVGLKVPTIANYSTTLCNAFPNLTVTPGAGTDGANSYANTFTTYRNNITIDSITVFYCLYNANPLAVTFDLRNATGASSVTTSGVQTVTPVLPANFVSGGYNVNGGVIGVRFKVGINVATAGTYRLTMTSTSPGNVFIHQTSSIAYAYIDDIDGNTLRINDTYGYTTSYVTRYGPLYNWRITAPKICDRLPVTAYVGINCSLILPVELIKFTAKGYKNLVKLDWTTSMEKNSSHFDIERSPDNNAFTKIGTINTLEKSNTLKNYTFIDNNPIQGGAYYRLVHYDLDGTANYSGIQYVEEVTGSGAVRVFPNPANNTLNILSYDTEIEFQSISITDIMGKEAVTIHGSASEKTIDISALPSGIYLVKVIFENTSETIKLIKN